MPPFDDDIREPEDDRLLDEGRLRVAGDLGRGRPAEAPARAITTDRNGENIAIYAAILPFRSHSGSPLLIERAVRANWDRSSIVLAGAWNQAIFSPPWVSSRIFPGSNPTATLAMLNTGGMLVQFSGHGAQFTVQPGRIEIKFPSASEIAAAENVALRILEALPETPIEAIGVNFAFDVAQPEGTLAELMSFADSSALRECGAFPSDLLISRQLAFRGDIVNLRIAQTASTSTFHVDLNFNFPIGLAASSAIQRLRGASSRAYDSSVQLLRTVYHLQPEE